MKHECAATHGTAANAHKSDGIARVYGMSNVQAEELVEYVQRKGLFVATPG